MSLRAVFSLVVLAAIVCVAAIFLHPVASGPFASTHGPVTALRARQLALAIAGLLVACGTVLREILGAEATRPRRLGRELSLRLSLRPILTEDDPLALSCAFLC